MIATRDDPTSQYEAARRQLSRALQEYADDLDADGQAEHRQLVARQRAEVIERGLTFFEPLRTFVRHELALWSGTSTYSPDELPIDDLVAAIYLAAVDHAQDAPSARAFYLWLRRIGRREVRAAIIERERLHRMEHSLETPVGTVGEWPDHVVRLLAILADPKAVIPDELLDQEETHRIIEALISRLPETWREVFLLRVVDGWTPEEVAEAEGLTAEDVRAIVESSRLFLRSWLEDGAHLVAAGQFA